MVTVRMAFRNIFRQKRRTLFTGLSIGGGFALAVVFIGWADGSYDNIIEQFTRNRLGQIQIHAKSYLESPSLYKTIPQVARIGGILDRTKSVESWAPRVYSAGLAAAADKTAGVRIIGLDPVREERTTRFDRMLIRGGTFGGAMTHEAILGRGLAELLGIRPGQEVVLVSQAADGSLANDTFTVVGIVSTGDTLIDRSAFYLPLGTAQGFLVLGGRVHEIAVIVTSLRGVTAAAAAINHDIAEPGLSVEPWQVFAKSFYDAMNADKAGLWVMLLIMVVIVAVGVLNTVLMSVLERRREYGLLRALGTRPGAIVRLVLLEVLALSIMAGILGAGIGLGANAYLSHHGIKFASGLTYGGMVFDTMTSEINARSFTIPAVTVILCALIVGLVPALKASRTEPARTMRMH